jgi:hypothetical protein
MRVPISLRMCLSLRSCPPGHDGQDVVARPASPANPAEAVGRLPAGNPRAAVFALEFGATAAGQRLHRLRDASRLTPHEDAVPADGGRRDMPSRPIEFQ